MAHRWMTLVGLVMLIAVAGIAFVDYEMIRDDADAARFSAHNTRAHCESSPPATIIDRKRLIARCERLPTPERAADLVERQWDRRGPWYGFAAGAILLPTAALFALSRRRRTLSGTLERSPSSAWRLTTIAVEVAVGVVIWLALYHFVTDRWVEFVEATGDTTHDCDLSGSGCGILGEFTAAHPQLLLWLFRIAAAVPAFAGVWLMSRVFRSLGDQPGPNSAPAVPAH